MNIAAEPQPLVFKSRIKVPYTWSAGEVGSRFLIALRDERKFLGIRCPECQKVYVPPKKSCGSCFTACRDWVEVGPEGTLSAFTQAEFKSAAHPTSNPIYGLILLKGASTPLLHLIGEAKLDQLRIGMKVAAVFSENRMGHILDVKYFRIWNV